MEKLEGRYVMVTTDKRGVFAGILLEDGGDVVALSEARNCVYWSEDMQGFLGLAVKGPSATCRIGPAAKELRLRGVTSIAVCTGEAQAAWEFAPWSK